MQEYTEMMRPRYPGVSEKEEGKILDEPTRCTKRQIVQPSTREGRYSMAEKEKIEKGVVSMLKLNIGVKSGERLLIATGVSTSFG